LKWRFVCGDDCLSRAIAWWGNGWRGFSHVDIVCHRGWLLGARSDRAAGTLSGVQLRPPDYLKGTLLRISTLELDLGAEDEKAAQYWAVSQIGRRYDMNTIGALLLGRKTKIDGRWICSALSDEMCVKFAVYHETGVPPQQITPDTHHALLRAAGAHEIFSYEGPPTT
jgi:hypothetical protein